jgi:hypothetical protein
MASTLPAPDVRSQLNTLRGTPAKARIAANPLDGSGLLPLLKQAIRETGMSQKELALNADVPESVVSEALSGRRHFAAEWWWAQPDRFLLRFLELVTEARQLTPENRAAIRRRRIVELIELLLAEAS